VAGPACMPTSWLDVFAKAVQAPPPAALPFGGASVADGGGAGSLPASSSSSCSSRRCKCGRRWLRSTRGESVCVALRPGWFGRRTAPLGQCGPACAVAAAARCAAAAVHRSTRSPAHGLNLRLLRTRESERCRQACVLHQPRSRPGRCSLDPDKDIRICAGVSCVYTQVVYTDGAPIMATCRYLRTSTTAFLRQKILCIGRKSTTGGSPACVSIPAPGHVGSVCGRAFGRLSADRLDPWQHETASPLPQVLTPSRYWLRCCSTFRLLGCSVTNPE